jgi:hypothetical protein
MLVCVLFTAVFTSLLTSRVTTGALASTIVIDSLEDVRGVLCITTAYPRLASFVRGSLAGRRDVRVVEDEVWACAAKVLEGSATAYASDRTLLMWYADTYHAKDTKSALYVSPALSVNAYSFGFANGSSLRAQLNPALIESLVDPDWSLRVADLTAHYMPSLATTGGSAIFVEGASAQVLAKTQVNQALLGVTLALIGATSACVLCARPIRTALGCAGDTAGGPQGSRRMPKSLRHSSTTAERHEFEDAMEAAQAAAEAKATASAEAGTCDGTRDRLDALDEAATALRLALAAVNAASTQLRQREVE